MNGRVTSTLPSRISKKPVNITKSVLPFARSWRLPIPTTQNRRATLLSATTGKPELKRIRSKRSELTYKASPYEKNLPVNNLGMRSGNKICQQATIPSAKSC